MASEVEKLKKRLYEGGKVKNFNVDLVDRTAKPEDVARQINAALDILERRMKRL